MKRILALVLALLMISVSLIACNKKGNSDGDGDGSGAATSATTIVDGKEYDKWGREMIYSPLPEDLKFDGEIITFLGRDGGSIRGQYESSENNTERVNDAIYTRNLAVQERLNVKLAFEFTEAGSGNSAYNAKIIQAATSGSEDYDIASTFAYYSSGMAYQGYYKNLLEVDNLHLDQPYWNQSYIKEAQIYNQLYMLVGDVSLLSIQNTFCVFFNKTLMPDYYADVNLYEMVRNKQWTVAEFQKMVKNLFDDRNSSNNFDEGDFFGLYTSLHSFNVDAWYSAYGLKLCERDEQDMPVLAFNTPETISAYEAVHKLLWDSKGVYTTPASDEGVSAVRTAFANNLSLFSVDMMGTGAFYTRNMESTFGVLPLPLGTENQENYGTTSQDSYDALAIVSTIKADRLPLLGAVLDLMSYESYMTVRPEYFETVTKTIYSSGEDDAEMYDLIIGTTYFDFGMINSYAISNPNIGHQWRQLLMNENSNFASTYKNGETAFTTGLAAYLEYYADMQP